MTRRELPLAWRRLLFPGLMTAIMLAILIGLGTWQIYRLHWKERILAAIAASERGAPVPLSDPPPPPWTKVVVRGHFLPGDAAYYASDVRDAPTGPLLGSFQIVPLARADGNTVLVERGWVPDGTSSPAPGGEVTVQGYVRPGDQPGWFSAPDDRAGRHFFTLDPSRIAASLGVKDVEPFVVVALGQDAVSVYPEPAEHLPQPPNNHLSYVVTWYGLAAALLLIFFRWAWDAVRA